MCGIIALPPKPPADAVRGRNKRPEGAEGASADARRQDAPETRDRAKATGAGRKLTFDQALAHVGTLDDLISEHGRWLIRQNARQYLWKYPDKITWCTACGKAIEGFVGRHGKFYACPRCGARAEFRYEAKGHRQVFDEFVLYEWRRSVIDAETVTLTATWVQRDSARTDQPHLAPLRTKTTALYVFRPDRAVTVYKVGRYTGDWEAVNSVHPEHTKCGAWNGAQIVLDRAEFARALEGTRIGRVFDLLREASGRWEDLELTAIANCARRPWLEYLAKCGQTALAADLLRAEHVSRDVVPKPRARTPRELLGLTTGQWGEVKRDGIALTPAILERLRLLTRLDIGPVKVADAAAIANEPRYRLELLIPHRGKWGRNTVGDMVCRLPDRLRRKILRSCLRERKDIVEWQDYYLQLQELEEVPLVGRRPGGEHDRRVFAPDADPALLLPRDMRLMHQRMTERLDLLREAERVKQTEGLRAVFEGAILPKLERQYRFEAEGLILRPYAGAAEVLAEGRKLSICIGGYAARYMRGETVICCLRRAEAPDVPWRAVEFQAKSGHLVQDRGYKNDAGGKGPETQALLQRFWAAFYQSKNKRRDTA